MENIISVKHLNYNKGRKRILDDINLTIPRESFIGIVGANASGKTTLLKILSGVIPTSSKVCLDYGYIDFRKNSLDMPKIGCYFSDYSDFLLDDVYSELAFPLENMMMEKEKIASTILEIADFFEMNKLLDKKCSDLKQEEKQLVGFIFALIHQPEVVILDNPFSMMRSSLQKKVLSKLLELQKLRKFTLIIATSHLEDIVESDYTYVLDDGKIVMEGSTLNVLKEDIYLKKVGLDLPFAVDLSTMLKFYEIYDDISIDYNEVIDKLWN